MATVTFLGTGSAFALGSRGHLSLWVEQDDFSMLVECGPSAPMNLHVVGASATTVRHLFVSHGHGDHALGFPMLLLTHYMYEAAQPLHVYAGRSTAALLQSITVQVYPELCEAVNRVQWHVLPENRPTTLAVTPQIQMHTAPVIHPPHMPTLAMRLDFQTLGRSLAFATDTFSDETVVELARGSQLLVHEANFSSTLQEEELRQPRYHSTAAEAGATARAAGCKRLALVHISHENSARAATLIAEARGDSELEVIVPQDGDRVEL